MVMTVHFLCDRFLELSGFDVVQNDMGDFDYGVQSLLEET